MDAPLLSTGRDDEASASGYASDDDDESAAAPRARETGRRVAWRGFTARTTSLYARANANEDEDDGDEVQGERAIESLDFHDIDSRWSRRSARKRAFSAKWIVTAIVGASIGVIAFVLDVCVALIFRARRALFTMCAERAPVAAACAVFALTGAILTLAASAMTVYLAPSAKGAGMVYVMSILNGVHVPRSLDGATLVVKAIGTMFGVSSGLMIGPEGPMVHIGTAVAAFFTRGRAKGGRGRFDVAPDLFASDDERADFLTAGVAAGLAAAFGAPIGGVLFALEEASTYWKESTTRRALFAATLATFVLALLRALATSSHPSQYTAMGSPGLLVIGDVSSTYYLIELPFFALLAASCGVVSGVVTRTIVFAGRVSAPQTDRGRVAQAVGVSILSTCAFFAIALASGRCRPMESSDDNQAWNQDVAMPLWCKTNEYNDVGSLLLSNHNAVISWILGAPMGSFALKPLTLCFIGVLIGLVAAANLHVPAGLFMPTIVWGSIAGRICAILVTKSNVLGEISANPHAFAIVGATAALAGMFRVSISVVVIMLEGTGTHAFLLPCLIAVAVSNLFSTNKIFGAALYEEQIKASQIPFLPQDAPKSLDASLTAFDVCAQNVVCFKSIERVAVIEDALKSTHHNGFPIVAAKGKRVLGLILRKQLCVLLSRRAFIENMVHLPTIQEDDEDEDDAGLAAHADDAVADLRIAEYCKELSNLMRTYHHRRDGDVDRGADPRNIAMFGLTEIERAKRCDLAVFMHISPPVVRSDVSARAAWRLFCRLSLRHLPVVGADDALVGILTRHDFIRAIDATHHPSR